MDAKMETAEEPVLFENETTEKDIRHEKSVKTDMVSSDAISTTADNDVNTAADWDEKLAAMLEHCDVLAEEHNSLVKERKREDTERQKNTTQMQRKKLEITREHQVLLEKLDSLRVKLQLNNSKSTRKNFLSKKEVADADKSRAEDERNRLSKDLEETTAKLSALTQEKNNERQRWQEELVELRKEMDRVTQEAKDTESLALQDEINAAEAQRDVAMERIRAWRVTMSEYMSSLRPAHHQEKAIWATKEAAVRRNQEELEKRFQEVLGQLQKGRKLESLPRINVPTLPHIPTAELKFRQMMTSRLPPVPPPHGVFDYRTPPPLRPGLPIYAPPPVHVHSPPPQQPIVREAPPLSSSPMPHAYPVVPSPPAAAASDTLDKVLDKLGARFPQCSRVDLTQLLQKVKRARGTLAGMSMEQVAEHVGLLLARAQGDASRPPARSAELRKLCLMCQKLVDTESCHPFPCAHAIHKNCIRPWIDSSGNNTCPFCPTR
ncbi:RING finger protein 214 [Syngnathoides biaculeatus]|uniref:RING finger protein 214 n=1 Tax=Syngnathoides biaculeatus TaxID=300417 RepID=UPI002ADE51D7|nr:RING finger protein 214 [Syngnathoides biaculeatus]XP_061673254.1 RING finger protein 214 [Syngnathoides biaculeatus]